MGSPSIRFSLPESVVVTGASSGLGQELCRLLIESGVNTVGVDVAAATADLEASERYTHVRGDAGSTAT